MQTSAAFLHFTFSDLSAYSVICSQCRKGFEVLFPLGKQVYVSFFWATFLSLGTKKG